MSKKNGRRVACEPLEDRRMFVTYQVTGTSAADAISISIDEANNKIISVVNGVSDSASDLVNNNIQIDGLGGNDTITIVETGSNTVVVNAGNGNDTINIGLGGHDLDVMDGDITVNGDGNIDTMTLNDENDNDPSHAYFVTGGNEYGRANMFGLIANVEEVVYNTRTVAKSDFLVNDRPTAHVTVNGNHTTDSYIAVRPANDVVTFRPDDTSSTAGRVSFSTTSIDFSGFERLDCYSMAQLTIETPNVTDTVTVSGSATSAGVSGTSSGVTWGMLAYDIDVLKLDLETNDAGAGSDAVTVSGQTTSLFGRIDIAAGTGTNTLAVSGTTHAINAQSGAAGGTNLAVTLTGPADVTFQGVQFLKSLTINNNATARFSPTSGVAATIPTLAVTAGTGNFVLSGTASANVATSFAIGAARTFVNKGSGTLNITAAQSHGAGATFENRVGTTNLSTDCGTSSARLLNVFAKSGTINFVATQHVNSVSADTGIIAMASNGNRVLVTNSVATGSEGGAVNLNNNDMIVDYASAPGAAAVRALLASGYADGSWAGLGINSKTAELNPAGNTALGNLEGTEWIDMYGAPTKFDGQTVDSTCLLIKYTYYGDVDFNGSVDASDYNLIDFGFVNHLSTWSFGDVDNNGTVDVADYNLIDVAFTTQTAVL